MNFDEDKSQNDYLMNNKGSSTYQNTNTSKLTELSQIVNCIDTQQNCQFFSSLENNSNNNNNYNNNQPSPLMTHISDNHVLYDINHQQYQSTPHHQINPSNQQSSNITSLPPTDQKNQQHLYFNNISPITRFQTNIDHVGGLFPITVQSQIVPNSNKNVLQTQTKAFTPQNAIQSKATFIVPQTSCFKMNNNTSTISNSRFNLGENNNRNLAENAKNGDEKIMNIGGNTSNNEQHYQVNNEGISNGYSSQHKVRLVSDDNKLFLKSEQSPQSVKKQEKAQSESTQRLLAKIKNEDELSYQREILQADMYLQKQHLLKHTFSPHLDHSQQNANDQEELPPNFGSILAKRTSPSPLLKANHTHIPYNSNHSQNQSGLLQHVNSQVSLVGRVVNNNSSIVSGLQNNNNNNNQSIGQNNLSTQNGSQTGIFFNHFQKSHQNSGQKTSNQNLYQFGLFGYQQSLNQTNDSIKNKSGFGGMLKEEKSIQESRAYLQAMKALQDRIKALEKQVCVVNEEEMRSCIESEYQQMIEESAKMLDRENEKNVYLQEKNVYLQDKTVYQQEQIQQLLDAIEEQKNILLIKERQFEQQREEWMQIEGQRNTELEQMQLELAQTQDKWQQLYQEHKLIEVRKIDSLQNELEQEKTQHNLLKSLCLKTTQEMETLLAQNKALDNKLQFKEKEFDEYRIQFNQSKFDLLKGQIQDQKEYLDKMQEQIKIINQQQLLSLQTELDNAKLIEKQLRNQIESQQNSNFKSRDSHHRNGQSPQSLKNNSNNQIHLINQDSNQNNSPKFYSNQNYQQNSHQNQKSARQQQANQANNQENGQSNSQNELERYLSPGTSNSNYNRNISNNNNNNQILNSNNYNNQNNYNRNNNQNHLNNQNINPNQNYNNNNNNNNSIENINQMSNNINLNQQQNHYLQNQQQHSVNQQMMQNQTNQRVIQPHQMIEGEQFSLQEESDLLNFDYDDLQHSRLNSKSSPIVSNILHKQGKHILQQSLDSPLRKRILPQQNVSSSLQITKQFQNSSIDNYNNNLNDPSYSFMNSHHQHQQIDHYPHKHQQGDSYEQNEVDSSPFFSPPYLTLSHSQHSPNFKTQNTASHLDQGKNETIKMNQRGDIKDNWSFKDQVPPKEQAHFGNNRNGVNNDYSIQKQNVIQAFDNIKHQSESGVGNDQSQYQQSSQFYQQQKDQQYPSSYLQYSEALNKELEYKKKQQQTLSQATKRSKSSNQSLHKQSQSIRIHKSSVDDVPQTLDDFNLEHYPSNAIGSELIRDIFEAESELKLLNQRYDVLFAQSRSEENSKKKSEIRKEVIEISEKIKILNEKLYVLKKREKFIMNEEYQKRTNENIQEKEQQQNVNRIQQLQQQQQLHIKQINKQDQQLQQ